MAKKDSKDMKNEANGPENEPGSLSLEQQLQAKEEEMRALKDELDKKEGQLESVLNQLRQEVTSAFNKQAFFEREIRVSKERANEELLRELVQVYDNFQRAICAMENTPDSSLKQGVLLIAKQLESLLHKEGVEEVPTVGFVFDCNLHQADCSEETSEYPEGTVCGELMKGYTYKGKTLRPARVRVAKKKETEE